MAGFIDRAKSGFAAVKSAKAGRGFGAMQGKVNAARGAKSMAPKFGRMAEKPAAGRKFGRY